MKSARNSLKIMTVLAVTVAVVVGVSQRSGRSPVAETGSPAAMASNTGTEEASTPAATVPSTPRIQAPAAAVKSVAVASTESSDAVLSARGDEAELAYQLGMDVAKLSPEARARLKADWEAQLKLTQSQAEVAQ